MACFLHRFLPKRPRDSVVRDPTMYSAFSSLFFFRSGPRRAPGLFCARILCVLVGLGILLCGADPAAAKSRRISVENKKYADIVMDAATGQVLHQTNPCLLYTSDAADE